jgi:DNA-directed RNA polymerase specialized sigma24 family protein
MAGQNTTAKSRAGDPCSFFKLQKEIALKSGAAPKDLAFEFTEDDLLIALRSLRQDYREIFVMKHIDNFSYKEISQVLGMTVSAVGEKLTGCAL